MKAKKLANYLLEHPDWNVQFLLIREPDEISAFHDRRFDIIDVGNRVGHKTVVLFGEKNEK